MSYCTVADCPAALAGLKALAIPAKTVSRNPSIPPGWASTVRTSSSGESVFTAVLSCSRLEKSWSGIDAPVGGWGNGVRRERAEGQAGPSEPLGQARPLEP